ncbi:MAG: hypothetical protein ABSD85_16340 [Acidimicrobiales bacterium]
MPSRPDASELADVVVVVELVDVVVVELVAAVVVVVEDAAGAEVVVLLLPELELPQPAAKTATVTSRAAPATLRLSVKLLASLIIFIP